MEVISRRSAPIGDSKGGQSCAAFQERPIFVRRPPCLFSRQNQIKSWQLLAGPSIDHPKKVHVMLLQVTHFKELQSNFKEPLGLHLVVCTLWPRPKAPM